jgi:hypothetical protein
MLRFYDKGYDSPVLVEFAGPNGFQQYDGGKGNNKSNKPHMPIKVARAAWQMNCWLTLP